MEGFHALAFLVHESLCESSYPARRKSHIYTGNGSSDERCSNPERDKINGVTVVMNSDEKRIRPYRSNPNLGYYK